MRHSVIPGFVVFAALAANAGAATTSPLWTQLAAKRAMLPGFHQEFEVQHTSKTAATSQSSIREVTLDQSQGMWRESTKSGSGDRVRIFDGSDLLITEAGDTEFVRTKRKAKDPAPEPAPYSSFDAEWSKAAAKEGQPCNVPGFDHPCVLIQAPVKPWVRRNSNGHNTQMLNGSMGVLLDSETGLMISARIIENIDNGSSPYQSDTRYGLKRMSYGKPLDAELFKLPASVIEVKELSRWDAARIRKQLAGKPAPGMDVTDLQGKPLSLDSFKGMTVVLDFWTTWCPPCRADAPALDKLYAKYKDQDLMIVGVSVSEERPIVEKFLKDHPHSFPIVLTSENEMPRPYQIGLFPTYIIIEKNGTLASVAEGDQGFSELRRMLKKAGLELD